MIDYVYNFDQNRINFDNTNDSQESEKIGSVTIFERFISFYNRTIKLRIKCYFFKSDCIQNFLRKVNR